MPQKYESCINQERMVPILYFRFSAVKDLMDSEKPGIKWNNTKIPFKRKLIFHA